MNITILSIATAVALSAGAAATAATYTFDTAADLTNNFNLDVVSGDSHTEHGTGYAAASGFPGSDGGFVHFNQYNTSNSLQFKSGPVTLNSFDISSQHAGRGAGVTAASIALGDYHLKLFDTAFTVLYDQVLTVAGGGVWETLTFDIANVSTIWIDKRSGDQTGTGGWWPNLDNITTGATINVVPVPASLPLLLGGFALLGFAKRRRSRK